jgi:hypothetical protein
MTMTQLRARIRAKGGDVRLHPDCDDRMQMMRGDITVKQWQIWRRTLAKNKAGFSRYSGRSGRVGRGKRRKRILPGGRRIRSQPMKSCPPVPVALFLTRTTTRVQAHAGT